MRRLALGLEWRDRTLTAVELGVGGGGGGGHAEVLRWGSETFTPEELPTAERIRTLLERHGLTGRTACLTVSGRSVSIKPIALPPLGDAEQLAILRQDGDRFFLLPRGLRCYGLLGTDGADRRWIAAASAGELEALLHALEAAGLFVERVMLAASLYPNALGSLGLGGDNAGPIRCVVRVTEAGVERARYRDGRVVGLETSALPAGGAAPTPRPESAEDADAVVLRDRDGRPPPAGDVGATRPATLVGAVAAALSSAPGAPSEPVVDLMPPAVRLRRERSSRRVTRALGAGCGVLFVLFLLLLARDRAAGRHRLDEAIRVTRARAEPVIAMQQELHQLSRRAAAYQSVAAGRVDYLRLLDELSTALPAGAWLASLEVRPADGATLTGYARSATRALAALARVPGLGPVRFDRPTAKVRVGSEELDSFSLVMDLGHAPH